MPYRGSVNAGRFAPRSSFPSFDAARASRFTRTSYPARATVSDTVSGTTLTAVNASLADQMEAAMATGNDYTRTTLGDMLSRLNRYGSLTEKAEAFARKLIAEAGKPRTEATRATVDLGNFAPMIALFDRATLPGKRSPKVSLRCDDVEIELTVAGSSSKAPGTINVATPGGFGNSTWFGRIKRDGAFEVSPRAETSTGLVALLTAFATDPLGTMVAYGKMSGTCAVCRRTLSDAKSLARGIGPICAAKFGF